MTSFIIEGGTVLTVDPDNRVFVGDIYVDEGHIVDVKPDNAERIDARGCYVMPGLVQAHVHLAQVLFRGLAEDLPLLEWLHKRIFLFEAAHRRESVRVSAQLGIAELLLSGTTSCLDMGTVHHTDVIFEVGSEAGFRLTSGKAMMDDGDDVPVALKENTRDSIQNSVELAQRWHGANDSLLRYAFAPRFILSCTPSLMREVMGVARKLNCRLHTHASENPGEVKAVFERTGMSNVEALREFNFLGPDVVLAHGVHLSDSDVHLLAQTGTHIAHCPATNLKLASGIADIPHLKQAGINVGIGCDGAPCNNALDGFIEMHLAALLQKTQYGATAMPVHDVLRMATIDGARALGIDHEVGSIEVGKKADIIIIDTAKPHLRPQADPTVTVVHACRGSDVRDVFVNGRRLVQDRKLLTMNLSNILDNAEREIASINPSNIGRR